MRAFHMASEAIEFAPDIGLPGRVLSTGKPSLILDLSRTKISPEPKPPDLAE